MRPTTLFEEVFQLKVVFECLIEDLQILLVRTILPAFDMLAPQYAQEVGIIAALQHFLALFYASKVEVKFVAIEVSPPFEDSPNRLRVMGNFSDIEGSQQRMALSFDGGVG